MVTKVRVMIDPSSCKSCENKLKQIGMSLPLALEHKEQFWLVLTVDDGREQVERLSGVAHLDEVELIK